MLLQRLDCGTMKGPSALFSIYVLKVGHMLSGKYIYDLCKTWLLQEIKVNIYAKKDSTVTAGNNNRHAVI